MVLRDKNSMLAGVAALNYDGGPYQGAGLETPHDDGVPYATNAP